MTSTSYTPDEDIGLLIDAMELYADKEGVPEVKLVVTGAGPLKQLFLAKFKEFNQTKGRGKVTIEAKWLEIDDYPKMVASADLGVCMHMSSSNLDLPMKVVDMFSCQLPCFAYDYPTIGELVKTKENPNGAVFKTSKQLFELMVSHLGTERGLKNLDIYSKNLKVFTTETWEEHWKEVMLFQKSKGCLFGENMIKK